MNRTLAMIFPRGKRCGSQIEVSGSALFHIGNQMPTTLTTDPNPNPNGHARLSSCQHQHQRQHFSSEASCLSLVSSFPWSRNSVHTRSRRSWRCVGAEVSVVARTNPSMVALRSRSRSLSTEIHQNHFDNNNLECDRLKIYNSLNGRLESMSLSLSPSRVAQEGHPISPSHHHPPDPPPPLGLGWYTCGPTTYAPAHLGHARTYVCLDILRRVLEREPVGTSNTANCSGNVAPPPPPPPLFVLNITDVDDKILEAASQTGTDPVDLARRHELDFWRDWDDLNCLRPHVVTRVTEHVESDIVPFVEALVDKGMAYCLGNANEDNDANNTNNTNRNPNVGGVYFDVRAYNEQLGHLTKYGKLAPPAASEGIEDILGNNRNRNQDQNQNRTQLCVHENDNGSDNGNGNDNESDNRYKPPQTTSKRDPRDFCLWKTRPRTQQQQQQEEELSWPSPWGPGRPGWHIECSAMIQAVQDRFATTHRFAVHAGGIDLRFPHHTNEIAQSEAYLGTGDWIPHWIHTGHLHIDGLKMSKSLKNFVTIREFLWGEPHANENANAQQTNERNGKGKGKDTNETVRGGGQGPVPPWESRSDDFRLWCLGLSGSYRGPATFSQKRMDEARSVRLKLVECLRQGEEWIRASSSSMIERQQEEKKPSAATSTSTSTSACGASGRKRWDEADQRLFVNACASKQRALSALRNDLDGSTFLSEILFMAEAAKNHCMQRRGESSNTSHASVNVSANGPIEPVVWVLHEIRELLALVGFTKSTTEAGISSRNRSAAPRTATNTATDDWCLDGEAIVDRLVDFRSRVREIALRDASSSQGMRELLALSDELRDSALPALGVRLLDEAAATAKTGNQNQITAGWKLCFPQTPPPSPLSDNSNGDNNNNNNNESATKRATTADPNRVVPLQDLFKVGPYLNQFSAYADDGMPTHNADGSEISKRLFKKLSKKRDKHRIRLGKNTNQ